jgi:ABC-2 type transport system permease protein
MLPLTLATASIGLYSVVATLLWGVLIFSVPLHVVHPLLFALSFPATALALGLLGLIMASTFVLYRHASAFAILLEYPVWLVTGLLVPVSLLPGFVEPISWLLAPTWGVRAVRESALGGDPLFAIAMCVLLSAAYVVIGYLSMANFERLARKRATLSLT